MKDDAFYGRACALAASVYYRLAVNNRKDSHAREVLLSKMKEFGDEATRLGNLNHPGTPFEALPPGPYRDGYEARMKEG